jgi:hypothetical protein
LKMLISSTLFDNVKAVFVFPVQKVKYMCVCVCVCVYVCVSE